MACKVTYNGRSFSKDEIESHLMDFTGKNKKSSEVGAIVDESAKQGGQFKEILKNHPELATDIDNTLKKYGDQYKQSLGTGSEAMTNVLQKTVEDKFDLNKPLPANVDAAVLNGHLNVLNNFDKNRQDFETNQKELQRQADLITDKAKREGQPVSQEDADRINQKSQKNIANWNEYTKAVKFAQNYVAQPEVKGYLDEFKKRQSGLQLIDEINQRSFPSQTAAQIKQDEYDRKAIEGNLNVWDYLKTAGGAAAKGLSNMSETTMKMAPMALSAGLVQLSEKGNSFVERMNNNAQQLINSNLPAISPEGIKEMDKRGMGHLVNDIFSTIGGFAPYIIPGMVGEGLGAKAATFATALSESLPNVRKEAEKQGLTGDAYNTFITAKPLVTAAFMTLLPSAKIAKGFDSDIAKAIVDGEFNSPKRFLLNLASKALKNPGDIAHLQAMLSGTAIGENIVNQVTNALQVKDDISKGISRKEGLPVDYSNVINPRQTAVMALAAKVMETVPTLKNTIGDFRAGKDVAETYDHIQNNLVELAAHNLEGVSNEVDKMVKKDPGNIYAQHLKNTIQDFAYAKARMPEGLEPEQEAALFDIQKQVNQKQRQYSTADPVYQPHLQKNIEELSKQIPDILKNPQKAIDYLKDAHKDFTDSILSPKAEENGKETEANAQTEGEGILTKQEGAEATVSGAAPSYQVSRHADTIKDEEGKVSGPNQHPLSPTGKRDATDLANEVAAKAESTGVPITKIIHSGLERSAETANTVANKVKAQTVSDPDLNTWGIGDFDDFKDSDFKEVQKWFVEHPDQKIYGGDLEAAKGKSLDETFNEYANRTIAAHAKYDNEPASTLLIDHSNNMMVMEAYHKNGDKWDEKSAQDYLNSEKPEPATLVQKNKVSYPKITNVKLKANIATGFKTEKGSTYEISEGGSTTRNKASREGHEDSGPQEKSQKTYYITPEDVNKLSEIQTTGGDKKIISETSDGKIGVKYTEGENAGKFERRTIVSPKEKPEVGLHPLEIWKGGKEHHFGSKITGLTNLKNKENAIPIGQRETVGAHAGGDQGAGGSEESSGVGPSVEGNGSAGESIPKEESTSKEKEVGYSEPISEQGKSAVKEANERKGEIEKAGFDFLEHEEAPHPTPDTVAIGNVGLKWQEHGKGLGTLGYILKGEEYLKKGLSMVSKPEYRTDQATGVWKKLVKLGLAIETSPGHYKYGGERHEIEPTKAPENDFPFIEEEGDNEFTSTKNEVTKQKVEDAGLVPAMQEAARDFGAVWKEAQKKLTRGFDIEGLLKTLSKKPRAVTDIENAMILFHQSIKESQLDAANKDLDQARKEGDRDKWNEAYGTRARLLDDLQNIYNVDKSIGRETARGLNARKMIADRRFSLVNMQLEKRASAGGEPLTDEQTDKVQKQYEDIKATKEALDTRVEELQKENAKLKAEKSVKEQQKATGRTKKTKEQYAQDRKDIVRKIRDDLLKAAKGGEGLTSSIPLAAQLKAVAPHIKKLVESFIAQGVDKLEDITKGIHELLSPSISDLEERHIHDLIAGEFNEAAEPNKNPTEEQKAKKEKSEKYQQVKEAAKVQKYRATDPKLMKLQADYEKAKEKFEQDLKKDQLKTRTGFQKIQDAFLKYERFAKLSNPITLGKLSMAALTRLSTTPIEEGIGAFYSTVLPGIAAKAPGEAGFHVNALAKGYKATFMRGLDDAAIVAKGGKTDIEAVYGKKGHLPPEAIDFFGQLHSAIKAPVKRFAFERSFEKRMANNIKNGTPIDGMVEARIAMEAYKDANRAIFMQDNAVSRGWSMLINGLERTDTPGAKELATGLQWLIPFVKVPTNIVGETISHVAGPELALAKILHTGLTKGLKNLSQDEAEGIMRNLKKGTIGHGALILGYLNPGSFGGYYQEKEKRSPDDVKFGGAKIFGHKIPAWMLEAPIFQAMQLGATVRRVKDKLVKGEPKGLGEGIWAGALGLLEHEPLIDEPVRLGKMLGTSNERQYFIGELAKSTLIPAASDYAAKVTDPLDERPLHERLMDPENKRRPSGEGLKGIKEHIESAIPGLRENVGEKKPAPHKQRQHKPSM